LKILQISVLVLFVFFCFEKVQAQDYGQKGSTVRILTFNILHGATTNGDFDLDKIAAVINKTDPDLVALQEVDFKTKRAKGYDLATELAWRTKMAPLFGIAMPFDGGAYGEGVLAKMPILSSETVALPNSPGNEPRAALSVLVQLQWGDTIQFIGTHLEHQQNSSDRIGQVKKIVTKFADCPYPTILAGDLNDVPDSEAISILKKDWAESFGNSPQPTYSSDNPERKIDYIFYRPVQRWTVIENKVICDTIASDHCAVFSVLHLNR